MFQLHQKQIAYLSTRDNEAQKDSGLDLGDSVGERPPLGSYLQALLILFADLVFFNDLLLAAENSVAKHH